MITVMSSMMEGRPALVANCIYISAMFDQESHVTHAN